MSSTANEQLSESLISRSMPLLKQATHTVKFGAVYAEYKDALYTFVLFRVGHDRDLAEDVVSDIFLKAYRNFDRYDDQYAISTWLYTIARNTLTDYYRKGRQVVDISQMEVADEKDPLYRLVTESVSQREVEEAVVALPETQRTIIEEQFFKGRSAKEVAASLDMSHAAVRKQSSRAVAMLRNTLLQVAIITEITRWFV